MVKVIKTTADQRWGRNEHHFHFKCANAKGGLEENDRAVNQLLAIAGSEDSIGQDKNRSIIIVLKMLTVNRDSTVENRGRCS